MIKNILKKLIKKVRHLIVVTLPFALQFVHDFDIIIIFKSLADVFLIQHT